METKKKKDMEKERQIKDDASGVYFILRERGSEIEQDRTRV
jgi:hypothetical protein